MSGWIADFSCEEPIEDCEFDKETRKQEEEAKQEYANCYNNLVEVAFAEVL